MSLVTRLLTIGYYGLVIAALVFAFATGIFFWRLNELVFAGFGLAIGGIVAMVYFHPKLYNYRFVAPALIALAVIIIAPLIYIVSISTTNLSESNKLNYHRAVNQLTQQTFVADDSPVMSVNGYAENGQLALFLGSDEQWFKSTTAIPANLTTPLAVEMAAVMSAPEELFDKKYAISFRNQLDLLTLTLPDGRELAKHKLRTFAERQPRFIETDKGQFTDKETGDLIVANFASGNFEIVQSDDSSKLGNYISPAFLKARNLSNYTEIITDPDQIKVFGWVFSWSVFAATFTVCTSFITALLLASLLNWPAIREREVYKFVLVACYALPAFAMISAFFSIFMTQQAPWGGTLPGGPVFNTVKFLFGVELDWQFSPVLSRVKFLIVQFWMFLPFMFILCVGVIQTIPASLYEAAKLEGAGARLSFFRITMPLTFKPLAPVLIIAFATAFNDLSLVDQLTFSSPAIDGSIPLATHVDLLVSFANRQAFGAVYTRGVGFGFYSLAATLFTLIFIILFIISVLYLRLIKIQKTGKEF